LDEAKYGESQLVENRVAVLLFGGTPADRQAWAEETRERLGGPLTVVTTPTALPPALAQTQGVVYLPNVLLLGDVAQQQLVRCLQTQEERPKLVVAVEGAAAVAGLRPDLHYRLRLAQVNLDVPGLGDAIAQRRARRALAELPASRSAAKRQLSRAPSRAKRAKPPARRVAPKTRRKPAKRASAKRSRRR